MSDIARYYDAAANPDGRVYHGVPLADIEASHWETLPQWLRDSVDASGMYKKSKPAGKKSEPDARAVTARPARKRKPAARKPAPAPAETPAPVAQAAAPAEQES